jgi:hypothetical protein
MKNIFTYSTAFVLGLALVAAPDAEAQQFSKRKQYNSVGFSLNAMNYFGDVTPTTSFTSLRPGATRAGAGLTLTRRFYPRLSGRLGLMYGRISGDDALAADVNDPNAKFRYNRNMNFRNDLIEVSGVAVIDLIENRNNYLKRPDFVPYVFGGVAGFYHDPQGADASGKFVDLRPLNTEGRDEIYSQYQFAIPFGGGVRYRINRNFDASIEIGWRKTFTDYIDDVGGTYAAPDKLTTAESQYFGRGISRPEKTAGFDSPGAQRGDLKGRDDWYITTGLSLNYILTPRIKNPKFR